MKKLSALLVTLIALTAGSALARPCNSQDGKMIDVALKARSMNKRLPLPKRSEAQFVRTLLNNNNVSCDVDGGFAGNIYSIETATHRISIDFYGSQIQLLSVQRVGFN